MQVIALQNMVHKGRRYKAGEAMQMDREQADALQFAGLVHIQQDVPAKTARKAPESGETEQPQGNIQPEQENAENGSKRGKKASK